MITGPWVEGTEVALITGTRSPMWIFAFSRLLTRSTGLARVLMALFLALIFSCGAGEMPMRSESMPRNWSRVAASSRVKVCGHSRPRS
ncbi:hypothetical protein D3C84_1198270 [compost metagenome]